MPHYNFKRDYDLNKLPDGFIVNTPGNRIRTKTGKQMLRHHVLADKLPKEDIFKNINNWYDRDIAEAGYEKMRSSEDSESITNSTNFIPKKPSLRIYTPLYNDEPFPNIVGKPKAVQEEGDATSRTAGLIKFVKRAAKYGHKPYKYFHHPFPEIIGINDPRRRHSVAYRSSLPHPIVLDILHRNAARFGKVS